jgi:hypothetical protein
MNWLLSTKDIDANNPTARKLLDEAIAAAPAEYVNNNEGMEMLPRMSIAGAGKCRLCGNIGKLTKEHIPPFASGNKKSHKALTFDDWLKDRLEVNPESKYLIRQGGIFGFTLCRQCNSLTGKLYGDEYKKWVERAEKIIEGFGPGIAPHLNTLLGPFRECIIFGSKDDGGVRPGAFIRQVLSCMCSLSGSWDLAEKYPVLRRIILEQSTEKMPEGLELGMAIYFGPRVRIHGPQLLVDMRIQTWRWLQEIAFPPFAFLFIIASNNKEPGLGLLIDDMTTVSPNKRQSITGIIELGFGWTPYPGDYRSQVRVLAESKKTHTII